MLIIDLATLEYFDVDKGEFVYESGGKIRFEYSLKAVYEWEGRWKKPFLKGDLNYFEMVDFYKLMALDEFDHRFLDDNAIDAISKYIQDTNTATKFTDVKTGSGQVKSSKINTSEEIYAMMFASGISLEFENRNLNRLLTILKIISVQNEPPKKMSKEEVMKQNREYNRQRKEQMNTKG